ncbi:MAG: S-methyl-5-thioribose-1-phosphate isomerase [Syntrophorhabdaceae bacterium]|nr:S-methyl-5-thioribose-1-phosphate isomerase [Syntrophorhabdaceae bacterium]
MLRHIFWKDDALFLLDQRLLPFKKVYITCRTLDDVVEAIRGMAIRGAPLIGIVAAYGCAIGVREVLSTKKRITERDIENIWKRLEMTRPTAVNLFWALKRMRSALDGSRRKEGVFDSLLKEAITIHVEDVEKNRMLSLFGAELIEDGDTILTHCNAGALATGGYGTALGVIRAAYESGKRIRVIATETRPYLQGARLTAWELYNDGIEVELVPDNHVGFLFSRRQIEKVIVGADRIALNGDTANKIGTFTIALCAYHAKIPFYVAAPISTFDGDTKDGSSIPIEERKGDEVKYIYNTPITLDEIKSRYYSFDITPSRYITSFITEKGIVVRPFKRYIKLLHR